MKPPLSILDARFRYTNATHTDLAKTFARIRAEAEQRKCAQAATDHANSAPVQALFDARRRGLKT